MIHTARKGSYQGGNGYYRQETLEGRVFEFHTLTCAHCSKVVILHPERERPRGKCVRCSKYLCDGCYGLYWQTGECNTTQEMLDLALAFPGEGPFLARAPDGRALYDTRLRDARRLW